MGKLLAINCERYLKHLVFQKALLFPIWWLRTRLAYNDGDINKVYLKAFCEEKTPSIKFCFNAYSPLCSLNRKGTFYESIK